MTEQQIRQLLIPKLASRYWRRKDASEVVAAWARSGMSMTAFARHFGICVQRLRRWKQRLAAAPLEDRAATLSSGFHPVQVVGNEVDSTRGSGLELVVRGGRRIVVTNGFSEHELERLVLVTERLSC
jgi:hypothetical protein